MVGAETKYGDLAGYIREWYFCWAHIRIVTKAHVTIHPPLLRYNISVCLTFSTAFIDTVTIQSARFSCPFLEA
jgi:hypothetical protein